MSLKWRRVFCLSSSWISRRSLGYASEHWWLRSENLPRRDWQGEYLENCEDSWNGQKLRWTIHCRSLKSGISLRPEMSWQFYWPFWQDWYHNCEITFFSKYVRTRKITPYRIQSSQKEEETTLIKTLFFYNAVILQAHRWDETSCFNTLFIPWVRRTFFIVKKSKILFCKILKRNICWISRTRSNFFKYLHLMVRNIIIKELHVVMVSFAVVFGLLVFFVFD